MRRQSRFLISIVFLSTLILSCKIIKHTGPAEKVAKSNFDLGIAKSQIEEINRNYMELVVKGDSIGVANLYAKDARLLFTGIPVVVGRANIQKVFARLINSGVSRLDLETIEVFGTEELLAEEGRVTIYVKDKAIAEKKSIILWKKEEGKWVVYRDIANSNSK